GNDQAAKQGQKQYSLASLSRQFSSRSLIRLTNVDIVHSQSGSKLGRRLRERTSPRRLGWISLHSGSRGCFRCARGTLWLRNKSGGRGHVRFVFGAQRLTFEQLGDGSS